LKEILEHGVARSAVGEDGEPGRFPQVSGIKFLFDTTKPVGSRVSEIFVGGKRLMDEAKYTLATSDFLVSRGGDGYTMFKDGKVLTTAENAPKDSEVFEEAIRNAPDKTIAPLLEGRITKIK
jgi:5'-nucleotidase